MISLALSLSKPGSSSEAGDISASSAEGKGAEGAFSAILATLGPQKAGGEGEIAATPDDAAQIAANGSALPVPAETGKYLPDIAAVIPDGLPETAGEKAEDGAQPEADGADTHGVTVAQPLPLLPGIAATPEARMAAETKQAHAFTGASSSATPEGATLPSAALAVQMKRDGGEAASIAPEADAHHAGGHAAAKPTHAPGGQPAPANLEGSLAPAALLAPVKRAGGEKAEAPSVALHVAPEAAADRSSPRAGNPGSEIQPVKAREGAFEGMPMPRSASAEAAPQAPSATFAQGLQAENAHAARPLESAKPAVQTDALQDLARVVERLAAAREAFAPAATAIAVKHAEFGDLSLRFDQQRNGQLAVQLSASDPDAHRAVVAAVGERGTATMTDSHSGAGQSQAQARGGAAERDANGGHTANRQTERQDQPQQRRSAAQDGRTGSGDAPRAGTFA